MIKNILLKVSRIGNLVLSWFNFFMFFAMRPCWSGISKTLGYEDNMTWLLYNLPVIIWILFFVIAVANTVLFLTKKKNNLWSYIMNGVNVIFLVAVFVIIALGAIDYLDYIWPNFFRYVGICVAVLMVIFFIFVYPKTKLVENKAFKFGLVGILCLTILANLVDFTFNGIKTGAVVYAVEKEYQIVFSSETNSRAWVEIDGERYFDNYNGSNKSYTKIHKVSVPMTLLNNAKKYTIHVQKITYRGPFGGYFGKDISKEYTFKPVDTSDGLQYYSLSDIHMAGNASAKAASYMQDKEILVLAGDIVSMMDTFADANLVNEYASKITNGSIPVVYSRGNHEIKGKYAQEFHNFVGTKGETFYYNFYLDGLYGLVLDIGEDHDDDYWEYYDTSFYEEFREEQIELLEKEVESKDFENYEYRLVVCHIPVVFINSRKNHKDQKERMTELLNKMDIDMMISGHQHDLFVFEPGTVEYDKKGKMEYNTDYKKPKANGEPATYGGLVTDHNFPNILVSKRGYTQTDDASLTNTKSQIGVGITVDFANKTQKIVFNNSKGEKVHMVNAFAPITYGEEIIFDLETKKHK
ncbi:MAG: metallophosphoesterase [Bacilli bacterium]|nr:metallophosphoesterase [Bacilli bacterium]